jgi:sortase A
MKKLVFIFPLILLVLGIFLFNYFRAGNTSATPQTPPREKTSAQEEATVGLPVSISIEKVGVNASIEHVGLDEKRNMDVPKQVENVAWYNLGPKPGERGSAVIAGHFDDPGGNPAVFYDLNKLNEGDSITVTDENNKTYVFVVTGIEEFDFDKFPLQEVFADQSGTKLNLITCGGSWNETAGTYNKRIVVYTELKIN